MFDRRPKLTQRTADEMLATSQQVQNQFSSPRAAINQGWPISSGGGGLYPAIVNTAITPFNTSNNTFGVGTFDPLQANYNSNTNTYNAAAAAGLNTNTLCLNNFTNNGSTVNSGTRIQVYFSGSNWYYAGGDC